MPEFIATSDSQRSRGTVRHWEKVHLRSDAHGIHVSLSKFPSNVEFKDMIKLALLHVLAMKTFGVLAVIDGVSTDAPTTPSGGPFGWKDQQGADATGVERKRR